MRKPSKVRFLFNGLTPSQSDRAAYERFADTINDILERVGVHADTYLVVKEHDSPVGIGSAPDDEAMLEYYLGPEAVKLSPRPKVCFRLAYQTALGAMKNSEKITKQLEGAILHEAWHVLSPHNPIANSMDSYCELLASVDRCADLLISRDPKKANAVVEKHFGSVEAFGVLLDKLKHEIGTPFERALPKTRFLHKTTYAQLADAFAANPFTLLPQEAALSRLPTNAAIERYFRPLKALSEELENTERAAATGTQTRPFVKRLKNLVVHAREWKTITSVYGRALEFSCDEFGKANSRHADSLEHDFMQDLRELITQAAEGLAVTLTEVQVEAVMEAHITGKRSGQETEAMREVADFLPQFEKHFDAQDPHHPNYTDRIRRLRAQDVEQSKYRIP